jgi:hypothetical protein
VRIICSATALLVACSGNPPPTFPTPDGGTYVCDVKAPTACENPSLRYADVKPIFEEHCVTCHFGAWNGPWPMNDYQHVYDWKDDIRGDVVSCAMPPYDGGVPMPMEQRQTLLMWIRCDAPE